MATVEQVEGKVTAEPLERAAQCVQSCAWFIELSPDWIVRRSSENVHHLLGESHVTLIDEPFGRFVHAQALHDLRNLFSRLSGTNGIARAYAVRLTDDPDLVDIAFQLSGDRVLLEAVPAAGSYGEAFGTVGGLAAGLSSTGGNALFDAGARRMRALTGYDRVTLQCGDRRSESSRSPGRAPAVMDDDCPAIVADTSAERVQIFPRATTDAAAGAALLRSPLDELGGDGMRSAMRVPFDVDGLKGEFRCESRTPRAPSFELHAAAELYAQMFAMRLEIDRLKG